MRIELGMTVAWEQSQQTLYATGMGDRETEFLGLKFGLAAIDQKLGF